MKKICCFIASMAGGGAERQMSYLTDFLAEYGYDVTLVTYNDIQDYYYVNDKVKRVRLNVHGNRLQKQWQIIRYLLKADMDCLISYRLQINFIALWAMLFRPSIKVIAGERNFTVTKPSTYRWWCMNLLYKRANWVVPNNFAQEDYLASHASYLKKKLKTIINYTDLDKFSPVVMPQNDEVIRIGVFARFYPQKNYERFALAVKELQGKNVRPFEVVWYGNFKESDGSVHPGYKKFCELIQEHHLQDVLVLKPAVKDVHHEMQSFHALCLPSLHEGFSNSIAEGICSARPMLVSNVGDNKLMVENGVNGYLFDPKNIHDIADGMAKFLSLSFEQRNDMAQKSRKKAEQLFNKERFINDYIKLIES